MAMQKTPPASDPEAYLAALDGWRRACVSTLREAVLAAGRWDEVIKWGHLVYFSNGPVLLIRAEDQRVLFGFWRGQRLRDIEPRLKPGGKYEMATIELREGMALAPAIAKKLAKAAVALNHEIGDPTAIVSSGTGVKKAATKKATAKKAASGKTEAAKPVRKTAAKKAAARKLPLSPPGSARKTPR